MCVCECEFSISVRGRMQHAHKEYSRNGKRANYQHTCTYKYMYIQHIEHFTFIPAFLSVSLENLLHLHSLSETVEQEYPTSVHHLHTVKTENYAQFYCAILGGSGLPNNKNLTPAFFVHRNTHRKNAQKNPHNINSGCVIH